MSINRTIKFYGLAYGDTPVSLDVKINGQRVFLNEVPTIPGPMLQDASEFVTDQVLFTLEESALFPLQFSGHYTHSVEVNGGSGIVIAQIKSNYMASNASGQLVAGDAVTFNTIFNGSPVNSENTPDPRSSVFLNGEQQVPPHAVSNGVWCWQVGAGSILSCNLNVSFGNYSV